MQRPFFLPYDEAIGLGHQLHHMFVAEDSKGGTLAINRWLVYLEVSF